MKLVVCVLVALAAVATAWPKISCKDFVCADGWSTKTNTPPENIACLGGICTSRTCCNPPTCQSFPPAGCVLKDNARSIQCRGETVDGCTHDLCCKRGIVPTDAPTAFIPACIANRVYYTDFLHADRVNSVDVIVDDNGVQVLPGTQQVVAHTGGADGIMVNPLNDRQLFVGGQQTRLFVIDTTNPNPATNWWRQIAHMPIFNVARMSDDFVLGFSHNGARTVERFHLISGSLANNLAGDLITLNGYVINVTAVIALPGGKFIYTSSTDGGESSGIGEIVFDAFPATTATLQPPKLFVAAHSGLYDAYSNTVIFWGGKIIRQYSADLTLLLGSFDATALIGTGGSTGFRHLDNAAVDNNGRLFLAANNGMLVWLDFHASQRISSALSGSFRITASDGLDAVTAPVCILP